MKTTATEYATTKNPGGKFRAGTIIEISEHPTKAENGRFVLLAPMLPQSDGRAMFLWVRLDKAGRPTEKRDARSIRGAWSTSIEEWIADGHLKIISEPEAHPACCGCADCDARYAA